MSRLASAFLFLMLILISNPAFSCPNCAGREEWSINSFLIMAAMVAFPFLVVAVTWWALKKMLNKSTASAHSENTTK